MTTMPVVWCSDPNSVNNKPTAFALHGIQLQGNVSEKQVLALRELVSAAAEGRLILPVDGTFVLLDSGFSLESAVVKENNLKNSECAASASNAVNLASTTAVLTTTTVSPSAIAINRGASNATTTATLIPANTLQSNRVSAGSKAETTTATAATICSINSTNNCSGSSFLMPVNSVLVENRAIHNRNNSGVHPSGNIITSADLKCYQINSNGNIHKAYDRHNKENSEPPDDLLDPPYSTFTPPSESEEILYEFLCCAKCMNESTKCSSSAGRNSSNVLKQYVRSTALRSRSSSEVDPVYSIANKYAKRFNNASRVRKNYYFPRKSRIPSRPAKSSSSAKSPGGGGGSFSCGLEKLSNIPVYATVNKPKRNAAIIVPYTENDNKSNRELNNFGNKSVDVERANCANLEENNLNINDRLVADDIKSDTKNICILPGECQQQDQYLQEHSASSGDRLEQQQHSVNDLNQPFLETLPEAILDSTNSSRKTSLDSTCTISSMDSGFIEMQNTISMLQFNEATSLDNTLSKDASSSTSIENCDINKLQVNSTEFSPASDTGEKIARLNLKECLTQSRNRRKSYEEFKALFASKDKPNGVSDNSPARNEFLTEKERTRLRRRSYQEFRTIYGIDKNKGSSSSSLEVICEQEKDKNVNLKELFKSEDSKQTSVVNVERPQTADKGESVCGVRSEKEKAKIRRKSYEEFKLMVKDCESNPKVFKRQNSKSKILSNIFGSTEDLNSNAPVKKSTLKSIYESLTKSEKKSDQKDEKPVSPDFTVATLQKQKEEIYKTNFKIYDKLISYGTIYDIIQRKNDIYNMTYQKYDKYMTYGTIYEILHRKTSTSSSTSGSTGANQLEGFQRKRAFSEKFYKRMSQPNLNLKTKYASLKFNGTIYDIIQKQHYDSATSIKSNNDNVSNNQSSRNGAANMAGSDLPIATTSSPAAAALVSETNGGHSMQICKYGTIYDIIQSEKYDNIQGGGHKIGDKLKNRFHVSKITESQPTGPNASLSTSPDGSLTCDKAQTSEQQQAATKSPKSKKKNMKIRRFSNILSYTRGCDTASKTAAKHSRLEEHQPFDPDSGRVEAGAASPTQEELYSHIKRNPLRCKRQIFKSNSLDTLSSVLSTCDLQASTPTTKKSTPVKKISIDNSELFGTAQGQATNSAGSHSCYAPSNNCSLAHIKSSQHIRHNIESNNIKSDLCASAPATGRLGNTDPTLSCPASSHAPSRTSRNFTTFINNLTFNPTSPSNCMNVASGHSNGHGIINSNNKNNVGCCSDNHDGGAISSNLSNNGIPNFVTISGGMTTHSCGGSSSINAGNVTLNGNSCVIKCCTTTSNAPTNMASAALVNGSFGNASINLTNPNVNSNCATINCGHNNSEIKKSPTSIPKKCLLMTKKTKSRRLSEFTRGEFLNEKP